MHKLLKLTFILLFAISLLAPLTASAIDLPCVPSSTADGITYKNDVFNCVNKLYLYGLVMSTIAAVFMIILAGYLYIFSGGNESRVGTAKSFVSTSLIGLAVLVVGFLILQQINPEILNVKNIATNQIGQQDWFEAQAEDGITAPPGAAVPPAVSSQCPGGRIVEIPQGEFSQYDKNYTCQTVLDALRILKTTATAAGVQFKVNDSFGPGHQSQCHKVSGTCVDIGLLGNTTWDDLCKVVKSTGKFYLLNESGQNTPACGQSVKTKLSTGLHLHLVILK